ncbi:glycosyltransferase family 4 protein [Flavobacterium litorale]|uniref:Glycosyltransferase family 4 protein n=1 Tax=Flavobacterium litorale TaxID=2856519 RepID=A0ABX8V3V6_9FLAO|nr:glycosyltransferase family 4 protein [Flavobacterium litorale]QYJ67490.1 glycosyltransferase family 4 protein [Flavobacterium litorale]
MRLVYITNTISGAGGIQRILAIKANYLVAHKNYDVTIIVTNAKTEEPIRYNFHSDIKIFTITPNRSLLSYYSSYKKLIKSTLKALNPNIIVMCDNGLKSFLLPKFIKHQYPVVYEMHVSKQIILSSYGIFKGLVSKYMQHYASRYDKFVVLTNSGLKEWKLNNANVIPNPTWIVNPSVSNLHNKIAVALGRQVREKGYDRMLQAWKIVVDKHPDWTLKIYGDSNTDYDISKITEELNITKNVLFCEPNTNVEAVFEAASINLLASRYEGFGMVLLEAAACGVPSVAFDCPVGPKNIITDGKDGLLITDGDIEAFASAVEKLIQDEELRIEMGKNAIQKAKQFAIAPIMEQWDTLFKSLVKN